MDSPPEAPPEVARLRRCLNDLISITALPALWADKDARHIATLLADAVLGMLRLAFVLVRLNGPDGEISLELMRVAEHLEGTSDIPSLLLPHLGDSQRPLASRFRISGGTVDLSVATARLGIRGEMGSIIAGSERADFPDQTEMLLLDVATNQAAIGLQHTFVLGEQKRVSSKLEEHVAQRTRELAAANEELRKRERNLNLIIDTIPAFVWCMLPDGSNEFISKAWHAHTGVPPEESRGWGWMSVFHPEDLPGLMKKWRELLISGQPDETEARIRRHDGVYRWFLIRAEPFRDESGNIVRWYGTSTDIEDRKRAEQALESRGNDLKLIIDTIPSLSWST